MTEIRTLAVLPKDALSAELKTWNGAGMVANEHGDLYGTSPQRVIPHGKIVIDAIRVPGALAAGWRLVEKAFAEADPDFAWMERDPEERP